MSASSVFSLQLAVGSWQSSVGSRQSSVGSLQLAVGSLQSAVGSLQSAVFSWQSSVGSWQSSVFCRFHNSFYYRWNKNSFQTIGLNPNKLKENGIIGDKDFE
ncbi:MAG: hypothetical protein GY869_21930 [Planctomycetes bacterium]|nr:hypothetical protein [Planctomycetota bacterium]